KGQGNWENHQHQANNWKDLAFLKSFSEGPPLVLTSKKEQKFLMGRAVQESFHRTKGITGCPLPPDFG
ncbi:MAG: hypothetical protein Q8877_03140, partial [Sweet potato little leaf phytoplasma]|nr:hypothetical protein [Sweet potato little leaf phytoplasma]